MNWADLHSRLADAEVLTNPSQAVPDVEVTGVCQDSRKVRSGFVFTAVQGQHTSGVRFIQPALDAGAQVILSDEDPGGIPNLVQVSNPRKASALIAAAFHGDPAESLHLTGITGTNGKTTTASLLRQVLELTGTPTGIIGTVTYSTGQTTYTPHLTTPDATELHPMFAEMVNAGRKACVVEVSSHALDQQRTATLNFSVAVFTNLMHDHLDYHKTVNHYLNSKKILFDDLSRHAVAVYNYDDPSGRRMVANTQADTCSFGQSADADIQFKIMEDRPGGLQLCLDGQICSFRLAGAFNAYNLAAAYGAACARGISATEVIEALREAGPVCGRFEQFVCDDTTRIIVDFAHTPDALEQVLTSLASDVQKSTRLWCVFGCGGMRDPSKRPLMGRVAERLAHEVVLTNDNPRDESAQAIIQDILKGMNAPERVHQILSRPDAIQYVAQSCSSGDIVLVAGKGHESWQTDHGREIPMKDQDLILDTFASSNPKPLN